MKAKPLNRMGALFKPSQLLNLLPLSPIIAGSLNPSPQPKDHPRAAHISHISPFNAVHTAFSLPPTFTSRTGSIVTTPTGRLKSAHNASNERAYIRHLDLPSCQTRRALRGVDVDRAKRWWKCNARNVVMPGFEGARSG